MAGYTLADVMSQLLTALQDTMYYIANAIASNANVIATVLVLGGLAFIAVRYGSGIFRSFVGWLRGFF
jgi:hypothetical protein